MGGTKNVGFYKNFNWSQKQPPKPHKLLFKIYQMLGIVAMVCLLSFFRVFDFKMFMRTKLWPQNLRNFAVKFSCFRFLIISTKEFLALAPNAL